MMKAGRQQMLATKLQKRAQTRHSIQYMRRHIIAMTERRRRHPIPSYGETQRWLLRLESDRAAAEEARNRQATLDDLLSPRYTADLPSSTSNRVRDVVADNESTQHTGSVASLQIHQLPPSAIDSDAYEDGSRSTSIDSDTDEISTPIELTSEDCGSPVEMTIHESGNASMEDNIPDHIQIHAQQRPVDAEANGTPTYDDHSSDDYAEAAVESQLRETSEKSVGDMNEAPTEGTISPKQADKGKGRLEGSPPPEHPGHIPKDYHADWEQIPAPASSGQYILRRPSVPNYDPDSTSDLEEPLDAPTQAPTTTHFQAVAHLSQNDCIAMIKEFLEQNSSRIDVFCTRREMYSISSTASITTNFSPAWDSRVELEFLTDAVLWLDALLSPFQDEIWAEDDEYLKPHIEHAVRQWHAIRDPLPQVPVSQEEEHQIEEVSDLIKEIQASNQKRSDLLECTNIDVGVIRDLLVSAETVRYRRDVDRENGQTDNLTESLRRIYRTVVCTIPVGLSEHDAVVQPTQNLKMQYNNGPFNPYVLPGSPEIFSHTSTDAVITKAGYTGVTLSEQRASLSDEYFSGMHEEMFRVIAAQSQDSAGTSKLRKNAKCMNRDWRRVYDPLFTGGMRRYEEAASRRIEREEREAKRQAKRSCTAENEEDRTASVESSPVLSDYTCFTDTSAEFILPFQDDSKPAEGERTNKKKFCIDANKPGGCTIRDACPRDHSNEGVHCNKHPCKFATAGTCAFLHIAGHSNPSQSLPLDLKPILSQVLANIRRYKVCTFINKPRGCKSENEGELCKFNHTLRGVCCPDFMRCQSCPRGDRDCPLKHSISSEENAQNHLRATLSPTAYFAPSNIQGLGTAQQSSHTSQTLPSYPHAQPQQRLSDSTVLRPIIPTGPRNQTQSALRRSINQSDAFGGNKRKHDQQLDQNQGAAVSDRWHSSLGSEYGARDQDYDANNHETVAGSSRFSNKRRKNDEGNIGYPDMSGRS